MTTTTRTLTPPEIGELVGLHAAARVTGDFDPVYHRIAELHTAGFSYRIIAQALDVLPAAARAMAQHAKRPSK